MQIPTPVDVVVVNMNWRADHNSSSLHHLGQVYTAQLRVTTQLRHQSSSLIHDTCRGGPDVRAQVAGSGHLAEMLLHKLMLADVQVATCIPAPKYPQRRQVHATATIVQKAGSLIRMIHAMQATDARASCKTRSPSLMKLQKPL
jgi:hypothetical protein